jgi:acetyl-CoA carboxylase biotin carboxylase subunit
MFKRILIANRGEIAVRVIRACRELGIEAVAVFSEADRGALHVREADLAIPIGPAPAAESYLRIERVIEAAKQAGAEAVHPGYGFLAENATFARAVTDAGLVFIGPSANAMEKMGDKVEARKLMQAAGVPVTPGSPDTLETPEQVREYARKLGLPVLLKAAGGGGGKGMRLIEREEEIADAVRRVVSEATASFGDGRFYLEKFVRRPRHIEVQIFADSDGRTVHLGERECSIQRRHQKLVEESPSPFVTERMRERMGEIAVRAARAVNYVGAGTIEFLADADRNFYFMEMNTRIQVEHPVTEMVTGFDLVKAQIEVAAGRPLPFTQEQIVQRGWAIECRVYAEDPLHDFVAAPGRVTLLRAPEGPGVRHDCGIYGGGEISSFYDALLSKLIVWGKDRPEAIARMRRALGEFSVAGTLATNLSFHRWLMDNQRFIEGDFDTHFLQQEYRPLDGSPASSADHSLDDPARLAAMLAAAWSAQYVSGAVGSADATTPRKPSAWKMAGRIEALKS